MCLPIIQYPSVASRFLINLERSVQILATATDSKSFAYHNDALTILKNSNQSEWRVLAEYFQRFNSSPVDLPPLWY